MVAEAYTNFSIEEIKEKVNLIDVMERHYGIKFSQKTKDKAKGLCPFHNDTRPSFSVNRVGTGYCFYCHTCQEKGSVIDFIVKKEGVSVGEAIKKAAEFAGLGRNAPASDPVRFSNVITFKEPSRIYNYRDSNGKLLYQALRYEPKGFKQRRPNSNGGWDWDLTGVNRVLYRLPELIAADPKAPVFIVEGEKDVDTLFDRGLVATSNVCGAGKWLEDYSIFLQGRNVVVLPDNDKAGKDHAVKVINSVYKYAATVKLVELPGLPEKGDVSDWLQAGHSTEELNRLVEATDYYSADTTDQTKSSSTTPGRAKPNIISARELAKKEFKPLEYIVPGVLPIGSSLIAAKPKIGKSWMVLNIAIAVASGGIALNQRVKTGKALYLALEDNESRLQRRLLRLCPQGVPENLEFATEWSRVDQGGLQDLEQYLIANPDVVFVAIDTLQKWRKPASGRENIYNADYEALDSVTRLAGKYNVCIMVVHHTRKGTSDDPLDEVSGSNGLTGAIDNALILRRERGEADAIMHRVGRDLDDDSPLALRFDKTTCIWSVVGNAHEYAMTKERQEIYNLLKDYQEGLSAKEIANFIGKHRTTVQTLLGDMVKDGQLKQEANRSKYKIAENQQSTPTTATSPTSVTIPTSPTSDDNEVDPWNLPLDNSITERDFDYIGNVGDVGDVGEFVKASYTSAIQKATLTTQLDEVNSRYVIDTSLSSEEKEEIASLLVVRYQQLANYLRLQKQIEGLTEVGDLAVLKQDIHLLPLSELALTEKEVLLKAVEVRQEAWWRRTA